MNKYQEALNKIISVKLMARNNETKKYESIDIKEVFPDEISLLKELLKMNPVNIQKELEEIKEWFNTKYKHSMLIIHYFPKDEDREFDTYEYRIISKRNLIDIGREYIPICCFNQEEIKTNIMFTYNMVERHKKRRR